MKDTVSMLNQQYVMPEGLQPYAGVTAKAHGWRMKKKNVAVKFVTLWKMPFAAQVCKTA